jgi:hypothetical protein
MSSTEAEVSRSLSAPAITLSTCLLSAAFVLYPYSSAVGCISKQSRTKPGILNYSRSYRKLLTALRLREWRYVLADM